MKHSALLSFLLFFSTSFILLGQQNCPAPTNTPTAAPARTPSGVTITTGLNNKHVQFTVSHATNCTRAFYLFEDGYSSRNLNPNHEFRAGGSYATQYFTLETYDHTPPAVSRISGTVNIPANPSIGSSTGHYGMAGKSVKIIQSWRAAEANKLIYIIAVRHPGGNPNSAAGTITLQLDPAISFTSVFPSPPPIGVYTGAYNDWADQVYLPSANNPNEVKWDFTNLDLGATNTRYYYVEVDIPGGLKGSSLSTTAIVDYGSLGNALDEATSQVHLYPWDPNGIEALHKCVKGDVPERQQLQYEVHFQNEGNTFVNTVQVAVDLGGWQQHDLESIEVLSSTHPRDLMGIEIDPNGIAYFTFSNINLPGTGQSYPTAYDFEETIGSFTFSLCSQEMLPTGDQIIVNANIYFDYLPPVYAGEAISFVDDYCDYKICENRPQGGYRPSTAIDQATSIKNQSLVAYPNPVQDRLNIEYEVIVKEGTQVSVRLYALSGQKQPTVLFDKFQSSGQYQQNFDLSGLPAGIYMLDVINGDQQETKRLVKMH